MEHALKLALVDPKHLEYKDLNKTTEGVAKSGLSMDMRRILENSQIPDDVKLKLYTQMQNRFLNVNNAQLDSEPLPPINSETVARKSKPRRKHTATPSTARKSTRKRKRRQLSPTWLEF